MSHHRVQPYHARDPLHFAIQQEIQRHDDSLWFYGELAMFCLLWSIEDHRKDLVDRCHSCWFENERAASAYRQGDINKCPACFGTSFEGGYRALIVRPVLISDGDEGEVKSVRGITHPMALTFESTTDFRVRAGDYLLRANGARYQLRTPTISQLRSGFATPHATIDAIGYHLNQGHLEDETSVAYSIPPNAEELQTILSQQIRLPADLSQYEDIRAPLRPVLNDEGGSRKAIDPLDKSLSGIRENPNGITGYP